MPVQQHLSESYWYLSSAIYDHAPLPAIPIHNGTMPKKQRNSQIIARHLAGASLVELAADYSISEQRVHQIVNGRRK